MSRAATFVATTVLVLCTGALGTATAKHHARDVLKQIFSSHPAHRLGIEKPNDICDHVRNLSYPCEHLNVTTVDGFVLDVIHMAPKDPESRLAKPVIMQHGLIMTAMTFVGNNDPQLNLACILHDQGYDVFLPNARGNHYSLTNARFPERNASFWQMVDWDEMAAFDVPAVIDLALSVNGQRTKSNSTQVTWVGHSEGTTVIFAALTTSATYVIPKINLFVALAPVAYGFHVTSAAFELLVKYNITNLAMDIGIYDALEDDKTIHEIASACPDLGTLCPEALASVFGYGNLSNFAPDLYPTVTLYTPGGTSMSNLQHWSQLVQKDVFQMHDFGVAQNMIFYRQATPPAYNLSAFPATVPMVAFSGTMDALADPIDVARLLKELPAASIVASVVLPNYAHMDFVWGIDAATRVYPSVIAVIRKYSGGA
jgi:lysosomal acid lipase/cholesteryl ester hydrolase